MVSIGNLICLREIKNTEGNEEYSEAGEGRYLWQNNGEDIHYKGKSDEELGVQDG